MASSEAAPTSGITTSHATPPPCPTWIQPSPTRTLKHLASSGLTVPNPSPPLTAVCPLTDKRELAPAPVRYVNRFLKTGPESKPFMGHPRPELDAAWHDLLAGTLVRYSAEELHLANTTTSIRHKEGGYVGGMGVSHQLHCLVRTATLPLLFPLFLTPSSSSSSSSSVPSNHTQQHVAPN